MKQITWLLALLLTVTQLAAQKKADRKTLANLQSHITYLASDKLEGRRTGTPGEQLAAAYIADQMKLAGLSPKGENGYLQTFIVSEGKDLADATRLTINNETLTPGAQFIPLPFSAEKGVKGDVIPDVNEPDNIWLVNVQELDLSPHAAPLDIYYQQAGEAAKTGAKGVIFYNGKETADDVRKWLSANTSPLAIPVVWVNDAVSKTLHKSDELKINMQVAFRQSKRTGTNVIGYIDNKAPRTIVVGAHYDHLGYGEDHNSLAPGEKAVHNGADDNASGTAALLELARQLKAVRLKNNNLVFVAFSGEELGLFGSKYFLAQNPDTANFNFMINMDMVGRLDASKGLQVGGIGTSPVWPDILKQAAPAGLRLSYDSSGVGPSDHTSFYRKHIPVLFFFTGTHPDYHKPTDDVDKINFEGELSVIKLVYGVIEKAGNMDKLAFTPTREPQIAGSLRFTVTLGIMPDYTYNKGGVRVDGISDGKPAQKAGLTANDIILQLGSNAVTNLEDYMQALSSFKKGDKTTVKVKRGNAEKVFSIQF